jgi:hypothetical protein
MKRTRHQLTAVGLSVLFALAMLLVNYNTINGQECRIVRLHGTAHPSTTISIEPRTVQISKGGCVIWSNWIKEEDVQIAFEEGKKCEDMTDSPVGFKMDARNCYVTSFITLGGTSSLLFNELGTFDYVVKAGGAVGEKGKVIVK